MLNPSNCIYHLLPPPPLVTLKSRLGLEEQPRFLDPVTVLTAINLSFITQIPIGLYHSTWFIVCVCFSYFIALHIPFYFVSCIV